MDLLFHQALKRDAKGEVVEFDIDPRQLEEFSEQANKVIREFMDRGMPFVLVTSPETRSYVRMIIERLFATLPFFSHVELAKGLLYQDSRLDFMITDPQGNDAGLLSGVLPDWRLLHDLAGFSSRTPAHECAFARYRRHHAGIGALVVEHRLSARVFDSGHLYRPHLLRNADRITYGMIARLYVLGLQFALGGSHHVHRFQRACRA